MDDSFLALATVSPNGMFWATAGGEWTYLNSPARELLGLTNGDISRWLVRVVQSSRRVVARSWRTAITEGRPLRLDIPVIRGGLADVVVVEAEPLRDTAGAILGWVGSVRATDPQEG